MLDHIKVMTVFCVPVAVLSVVFGDLLVGMEVYPCYVGYVINTVLVVGLWGLLGRSPGRRSLLDVVLGRGDALSSRNSSEEEDEAGEKTALLS